MAAKHGEQRRRRNERRREGGEKGERRGREGGGVGRRDGEVKRWTEVVRFFFSFSCKTNRALGCLCWTLPWRQRWLHNLLLPLPLLPPVLLLPLPLLLLLLTLCSCSLSSRLLTCSQMSGANSEHSDKTTTLVGLAKKIADALENDEVGKGEGKEKGRGEEGGAGAGGGDADGGPRFKLMTSCK
eukprot:733253-Hanusia_phi.AAC.3